MTQIMVSNKAFKVAIDGPSGVGKSTTAIELAKRFNFNRVDSGMLYRTVTYAILHLKEKKSKEKYVDLTIQPEDIENNKIFIENIQIEESKNLFVLKAINNESDDISFALEIPKEDLRTQIVDKNVSVVAKYNFIRQKVGLLQRKLIDCSVQGVIVDGRDIGTVVMPDADVKIFLTASKEVRAKRRYEEMLVKNNNRDVDYDQVYEDLQKRDENDINRKYGPLKKASDAIEVDNSEMSFDKQIDTIAKIIFEKCSRAEEHQ